MLSFGQEIFLTFNFPSLNQTMLSFKTLHPHQNKKGSDDYQHAVLLVNGHF